jgi:hypothetical protein
VSHNPEWELHTKINALRDTKWGVELRTIKAAWVLGMFGVTGIIFGRVLPFPMQIAWLATLLLLVAVAAIPKLMYNFRMRDLKKKLQTLGKPAPEWNYPAMVGVVASFAIILGLLSRFF